MTPMIDVLLVLIIIFMVIIPSKSVGLKTLVPEDSTQATRPEQPEFRDIVITVHRDGGVDLNREALDIPRLRERLMRLFIERGAVNVVFVRGDGDVEFANVAEVIDATRGSGVNRIALMPN